MNGPVRTQKVRGGGNGKNLEQPGRDSKGRKSSEGGTPEEGSEEPGEGGKTKAR